MDKEFIQALYEKTKKLTLLYVEDNLEARTSTQPLLEEFFPLIYVAVDGLEALEILKTKSIDILLTDLNMPKMGGLELINQINLLDLDKEIMTIVLSAHNEETYMNQANKLNVDGYLLKPLDLAQVVLLLSDTIDKNISS